MATPEAVAAAHDGRWDLEIALECVDRPPVPERYERWDEDGFRFRGDLVSGELQWESGRGRFAVQAPSPRDFRPPDAVVHYLARVLTQAVVLRRGGVMCHAATLLIDGATHVVCGASGTGKTTLFERVDGAGIPGFVGLGEEWAYLVPTTDGGLEHWWWRASRSSSRQRPWVRPVAAIHHLTADRTRTHRAPLMGADATKALILATYFIDGDVRARILDNCVTVAARAPGYLLSHSLATPNEELRLILAGGGSDDSP